LIKNLPKKVAKAPKPPKFVFTRINLVCPTVLPDAVLLKEFEQLHRIPQRH
jgi:hypothetical protein